MFCLLVVVVVSKAAREKLKLRKVGVCVQDSRQPPSSEKILERKSTKMNTTPELLLFFTRSFATQAEMELL